jgi:hypothetical protein
MRRFHIRGIDPDVLQSYIQHRWFDDDALEWAKQGIEAQDAYTWLELGIRSSEAGKFTIGERTLGDTIREWWGAGIPLDEVAEWSGAGLSAGEAADQRARGISAERAAALRALQVDSRPTSKPSSPNRGFLAHRGPPEAERIGPPPADELGARDAITAAYQAIFSRAPATDDIVAVAGGGGLGTYLERAFRRYGVAVDGSTCSVKIDLIHFVNDHYARVLFSVTAASVYLPWRDISGRAVMADESWKVARTTFCRLMQLLGEEVPAR